MPPRKKQPTDAGADTGNIGNTDNSGEAPVTTGRGRKKAPASQNRSSTPRTPRKSSKSTKAKAQTFEPAPENGLEKSGKGKHDLIIVESPKKAQTINKYLGSNYRVLASYGHVRDLPTRRRAGEQVAGVDIAGGWLPTYVVVEREGGKVSFRRRTAKEILAELKREAAQANRIYLATDPDREGEAIAWHIQDELRLPAARTFRIAFNEITQSVIRQALANPGKVDLDRVRAQEARRILDRVVGYPLSNLLSKKVARNSSAGRVQSVALRLVVDREREIESFVAEEYWRVSALLAPQGTVSLQPTSLVITRALKKTKPDADELDDKDDKPGKGRAKGESVPETPPGTFLAELVEWLGQKFEPKDEATALSAAQALDRAQYRVVSIEQKDRADKAPPPFTTSTLQQQASTRLHFNVERTMRTAQKLYEGVDLGPEGSVALITYMRTDSTRVSNEALQAVRGHIQGKYGSAYLPPQPNFFASGKSAQEAHEAIRPTDLQFTPERVTQLGLHGDQLRLYTLIYNRFVASQMNPAIWAVTTVDVEAQAGGQVGLLRASGRVLKFDGYRRVQAHVGKQEDAELPAVHERQLLDRLGLTASQHFTKPPARYNEASLVRALEKEGIGRPSTYATIIGKITSEERAYIEVRDRRFFATEIGKKVTDLLVEHFPRVMNLKFTSHMEEELDGIESRTAEYRKVLDEFWGPFSQALEVARASMPSSLGVETGENCPRCNRPLVRNYSKKTRKEFVGCSGFRDKENPCKYIQPEEGEPERPAPIETDHLCPTCNKRMIQITGRTGPFLRCSGHPDCLTKMNLDDQGRPVLAALSTQHTCEKCSKPMVIREGKRGPFLACTGYPKCKNAKDVDAQGNPIKQVDLGIQCDKCGKTMAVRQSFRGPFLGCTGYPECRSTKKITDEMRAQLNLPAAPPSKKATPTVEVSETCPDCSSPMKARQGRKGWFLGCSKYPRCRGVREASAELIERLSELTVDG